MSVYRFIEAQKAKYPVSLMARVLRVSRSGYYAWRGRGPSAREAADAELAERIGRVHAESRGTYGYPRVHAKLRGEQVVGRNRVARLMRARGLSGCRPEDRRSITRRDKDALPAPDLVGRRFLVDAPNKLWLADITYVPTLEGWLYLAFVLDAHSRKVVGWSMAGHLRAELVVDALEMAVGRRRPGEGLIHHSDRGFRVHLARVRQRSQRGSDTAVDGRRGGRVRQRDGGVVRVEPQARADRAGCVADEGGGESGDLRVHRGVLQPKQAALGDRLPQP